MKQVKEILGWVSVVSMVICGIVYWGNVWGPIGFFGAILTIPISTFLFLLLNLFNGYFFQMIVWVGVTVWLLGDL